MQKSVTVTESLHLEETPEKHPDSRGEYHHVAKLPGKDVKRSLGQE